MRKDEMITTANYVEYIEEQRGYYKPPMISAKDYAREIQSESISRQQKTTLVTVRDYIEALSYVGYTKSDAELEAKIEEYLRKKHKSERNAQAVTDLLAY